MISSCILREVGGYLPTGDLIALSLVDAATEYQLRPQLKARSIYVQDFRVNDMAVYDWLIMRDCLRTAIHFAIYNDLLDICQALVKKYKPKILKYDDLLKDHASDYDSLSTDDDHNILMDTLGNFCLPIAAKNGNLNMCKWLVTLFDLDFNLEKFTITLHQVWFTVFFAAVNGGHVDVCEWLMANCNLRVQDLITEELSIRKKSLMIQFGGALSKSSVSCKWALGVLDLSQLTHLHFIEDILVTSCTNNQMDTLTWLLDHLNEKDIDVSKDVLFSMFRATFGEGHLDICKYMHLRFDIKKVFVPQCCGLIKSIYLIAKRGHLDMMVWLMRHIEFTTECLSKCLGYRKCKIHPVCAQWLSLHKGVIFSSYNS